MSGVGWVGGSVGWWVGGLVRMCVLCVCVVWCLCVGDCVCCVC